MDEAAAAIAHLYRRAGFGAGPAELDAATARGYEATVDHLLDLDVADTAADAVAVPPLTQPEPRLPVGAAARKSRLDTLRREGNALVAWWLQRMVVATNPLREKLTLFWHGHFATSLTKVGYPSLMYKQNQLLRALGPGSFEDLAQGVAKDPAMLLWLDAAFDKKGQPNENFARELFELFTLGLGNYTETDVKEAARCFTGWALDRQTGMFTFQPGFHDGGTKTVLGTTGSFGGEDVIHRAVHQPASNRFVVAKVWSHFAWPVTPDDPIVGALVGFYGADLNVRNLMRAVFLHPEFQSPQARTGLVKQPVEYIVGALRALHLPASDSTLPGILTDLGQLPFSPPNVGGWPQNGYWLSTASSYARLRFAASAVQRANLTALDHAAPADRPDAAARLLSVAGWSPSTASALATLAGDSRSLMILALVSPEYVLN